MTSDEITRLAKAFTVLRPQWPYKSLHTYLTDKHSLRLYKDVLIALSWIAADPESRTPALLDRPGPWWDAAVPPTHGPERPQPPAYRSLRHPNPGDANIGIAQCRAAITEATSRRPDEPPAVRTAPAPDTEERG
jgi:hypothetical protein